MRKLIENGTKNNAKKMTRNVQINKHFMKILKATTLKDFKKKLSLKSKSNNRKKIKRSFYKKSKSFDWNSENKDLKYLQMMKSWNKFSEEKRRRLLKIKS